MRPSKHPRFFDIVFTFVPTRRTTPSRRYALETYYNFRCSSWVDDNLPIHYVFKYKILGSASSVASPLADAQLSTSISAMLPLGTESMNFTVLGVIDVEDSFNAQSEVDVEVQVREFDYASGGRRQLLGTRPGWTFTEHLANKTNTLVSAAMYAGDVDACNQAVGGVATILNARNATDDEDALARQALRTQMITVEFPKCASLMETTTTAVTQRSSTLALVVHDGSELGVQTQAAALVHAQRIASESEGVGLGIDTVAASELGGVISAVLNSRRSMLDDGAGDDELVSLVNVTATLKSLCSSLLETSKFAGAEDRLSTERFGISCYRESADRVGGVVFKAAAGSAAIVLPSNISEAAHLERRSGDYTDFTITTFDQDFYSVTSNSSSLSVGSDGNPSLKSMNGGVLVTALYAGTPWSFGKQILIDSIGAATGEAELTVEVSTPYNLTFAQFQQTCFSDETLTFACPLKTERYTCNASTTQFGTYFVAATCPGVIPQCKWWDSSSSVGSSGSWRDDGCRVANYTETNVTCACASVPEVVAIASNISKLVISEYTTFAPTATPTPAPTAAPTFSPTSSPTSAPTSPPTLSPSLSPTSSPTPMPTAVPTPTPVPTTSPTYSFVNCSIVVGLSGLNCSECE